MSRTEVASPSPQGPQTSQSARGDDAARLRLLVQDLRDSDLLRLAAFLRIGDHRWQVVFEGEADLVLFGGVEPDTVRGMLEPPAAVVRVVDGALMDSGRRALVRPIDYDDLTELLRQTAHRINLPVPPAPARTAALPAPVPARTATPVGSAAPAVALPHGSRFRLRRWPPQALLQDAQARRLAAFMTLRPIDLAELATLSNAPASRCCAFVTELNAAHLLQVDSVAPAPPATIGGAALAPAQAGRGLLGRIRRSLGLG